MDAWTNSNQEQCNVPGKDHVPSAGFDIAVVVVVVVLVNQSIPKEASRSETGSRGDVFVVRTSKPV